MENAIIMASGLGTRMQPLTLKIPKPLIKVNNKPMIETVIDGLLRRKIGIIYIVIGYLGDQFEYLKEKYPMVKLIQNKDYKNANNISSVYYARQLLEKGACFICEADLYIPNGNIFNVTLNQSCYFGKLIKGYSDDWVFDLDDDGRIIRVGKIGTDCYNMVGISYFTKNDAIILKNAIEEKYQTKGNENLFWDEVVNENLNIIDLKIQSVSEGQIMEIDTPEELQSVNKWLLTNY